MTESIKYPDAQQLTVHGRIAFLEEAEHEDRTFLAVKVYTTISDEILTVAIRFGNSNGLLTAYRNGNLQVGQELTLMGRITGMRAFYTKEEDSAINACSSEESRVVDVCAAVHLWLQATTQG